MQTSQKLDGRAPYSVKETLFVPCYYLSESTIYVLKFVKCFFICIERRVILNLEQIFHLDD